MIYLRAYKEPGNIITQSKLYNYRYLIKYFIALNNYDCITLLGHARQAKICLPWLYIWLKSMKIQILSPEPIGKGAIDRRNGTV